MGIFDSLERLITEHGSAAILKERLSLAAEKYSSLERENTNLKRQLSELETSIQSGGHIPVLFDLNSPGAEFAGDSEPPWISPRLRLGYGVILLATSEVPNEGWRKMLGLATKWLPYGAGYVRSGWLFHAWHPVPAPDHTFFPMSIYTLNSRHAVIFFKLHVSPDNTGYIHLSSASNHLCNVSLETSTGERISRQFMCDARASDQRQSDTWTFTVDYSLGGGAEA